MADQCLNCGAKITDGAFFGAPNNRLSAETVRVINFVEGFGHKELCDKCGGSLRVEATAKLTGERDTIRTNLERLMADFPMMTIGVLPGGSDFRVLGMVTGNVTVGTGLFNEFSQGVSDMFGAVNTQTGMAGKVNKGEASARQLLVQKAVQMGANCIIGVDIDYGVTGNNAATVNMQGTAVRVTDLAAVLDHRACEVAEWIEAAWQRLPVLNRWLAADFRMDEVYERQNWGRKSPP